MTFIVLTILLFVIGCAVMPFIFFGLFRYFDWRISSTGVKAVGLVNTCISVPFVLNYT